MLPFYQGFLTLALWTSEARPYSRLVCCRAFGRIPSYSSPGASSIPRFCPTEAVFRHWQVSLSRAGSTILSPAAISLILGSTRYLWALYMWIDHLKWVSLKPTRLQDFSGGFLSISLHNTLGLTTHPRAQPDDRPQSGKRAISRRHQPEDFSLRAS